jgi:MFS family permease
MLGILMDVIGRRIPITAGLVVGSCMLVAMTCAQVVYPWLLICLCVLAVSGSPAENAPLVNDYVQPKSYGLVLMYTAFMQYLGTTVATSVTIGFQRFYSINLIFRVYAGMIFIFSILVAIGISDNLKKTTQDTEKLPLKKVLKQCLDACL